MNSPSKVSVGIGTYAGLGTAFTAFVGGIVAIFMNKDFSEETITAFAVGTVTLVTTLIGRFSQAKEQIKATAAVTAAVVAPDATPEALIEPEDAEPVERGLGSPEEPYLIEDDFDPKHEERDIHEAI